jgi:hypothetical protein
MPLNAVYCLKQRLRLYPGVQFMASDSAIKILEPNPNGFALVLIRKSHTWRIQFEGWRCHLSHASEAVELVLRALEGEYRLRIVSRAGVAYEWSLQRKVEGDWQTYRTVVRHSLARILSVWGGKCVSYKQNALN